MEWRRGSSGDRPDGLTPPQRRRRRLRRDAPPADGGAARHGPPSHRHGHRDRERGGRGWKGLAGGGDGGEGGGVVAGGGRIQCSSRAPGPRCASRRRGGSRGGLCRRQPVASHGGAHPAHRQRRPMGRGDPLPWPKRWTPPGAPSGGPVCGTGGGRSGNLVAIPRQWLAPLTVRATFSPLLPPPPNDLPTPALPPPLSLPPPAHRVSRNAPSATPLPPAPVTATGDHCPERTPPRLSLAVPCFPEPTATSI